jgi:hypothetical protein
LGNHIFLEGVDLMKKDIAHIINSGNERVRLAINRDELQAMQSTLKDFAGNEWVYIDLDMMRLLKTLVNSGQIYTLTNEDQKPIKN